MVSTNSNLRIAVLSDIHLGHRHNHADHIATNLRHALPDNAETAALDMVILAGDVFDSLLDFNDEAVIVAELWIAELLRLCAKHAIKLRVLEGTPSHDWKQSQQFVSINAFAKIGADLKYVKELTVEYEQDHDAWFLFVPDEWGPPETTLSQVRQLLDARGLTHVDYAVMHGQFDFQLPEFVKAPKHDSKAYLDLVKHWIWIGHDHTFKHHERIFAQGSFDRLKHGFEEPKGHVRTVIKHGKSTMQFVENTQAMIFKTLTITEEAIDDALIAIRRELMQYPENAHIRLRLEQGHPLISNLMTLRQYFPEYHWDKAVVTINGAVVEDTEKEEAIEDETDYEPLTITRENIEQHVMSRIKAQHPSPAIEAQAHTLLLEVM